MQLRHNFPLIVLGLYVSLLPHCSSSAQPAAYEQDPRFGQPRPGFTAPGYEQSPPWMQRPDQGGYYQYQQNAGMPLGAQPQGLPQAASRSLNPKQAAKIYSWFLRYDEIRRRAQMNPIEKQQSDSLLSRKLSLFMPGQDKVAAKEILTNLARRYQQAAAELQALPMVSETVPLQRLYFQYFDTAMRLFSDYLRVQDNLLAVDESGQPIAAQLLQRKVALENLERACKDLDAQTRAAYGVSAYVY